MKGRNHYVKYRIVSAKPKGATNHCNSQFKMYQWGVNDNKTDWWYIGWKSINQISDLLAAGHEIKTGQYAGGNMTDGAPVEVELRIMKNNTNFKITDMPDVRYGRTCLWHLTSWTYSSESPGYLTGPPLRCPSLERVMNDLAETIAAGGSQ